MANIILLTGEPRAGKTTTLKKIITGVGVDRCGGFYTEEVRDEIDRVGFDCITLDGEKSRIADVNFVTDIRVSKYGVNIGNFENVGIHAIYNALKTKDIIVIDEVGPMQLLSDKFKEVLEVAFKSEKIIIGTIFLKPHPVVDEIKKNNDIDLVEVTYENRNSLPDKIVSIINQSFIDKGCKG